MKCEGISKARSEVESPGLAGTSAAVVSKWVKEERSCFLSQAYEKAHNLLYM